MNKNIGFLDRVVRLLGGALLLALGLFVIPNNIVRGVAIVLGLIAVLESFIGYCYLYQLLEIDTCLENKKRLWKVIAWVFALCGMAAYVTGWLALMKENTLWVPTEFWFYDALVAGIFAVFFSHYAHHQEEKMLPEENKVIRSRKKGRRKR